MKRKNTTLHIIAIVMVLASIAMGHITHQLKQECERLERLEYYTNQIHNHGTLCNVEHQMAKIKEL